MGDATRARARGRQVASVDCACVSRACDRPFTVLHNACCDHLWKVVQEEWANMDPAKLYSISEHQLDVAEEVKRRGGQHLLKQPHGGATKRTADAIEAARKK